jgi:hypothetical protein
MSKDSKKRSPRESICIEVNAGYLTALLTSISQYSECDPHFVLVLCMLIAMDIRASDCGRHKSKI